MWHYETAKSCDLVNRSLALESKRPIHEKADHMSQDLYEKSVNCLEREISHLLPACATRNAKLVGAR